jgi:hypothetical protein
LYKFSPYPLGIYRQNLFSLHPTYPFSSYDEANFLPQLLRIFGDSPFYGQQLKLETNGYSDCRSISLASATCYTESKTYEYLNYSNMSRYPNFIPPHDEIVSRYISSICDHWACRQEEILAEIQDTGSFCLEKLPLDVLDRLAWFAHRTRGSGEEAMRCVVEAWYARHGPPVGLSMQDLENAEGRWERERNEPGVNEVVDIDYSESEGEDEDEDDAVYSRKEGTDGIPAPLPTSTVISPGYEHAYIQPKINNPEANDTNKANTEELIAVSPIWQPLLSPTSSIPPPPTSSTPSTRPRGCQNPSRIERRPRFTARKRFHRDLAHRRRMTNLQTELDIQNVRIRALELQRKAELLKVDRVRILNEIKQAEFDRESEEWDEMGGEEGGELD